MFGSSAYEMIGALVFAAILLTASFSDLRERRIPNALVIVTALLGVTYCIGHTGRVGAALVSLAGMAVGLAIWMPCYWLRMMGAGDVKFFAAAAAWLAPGQVLSAAVLSALFGGLLAVAWLLRSWSAAGRVDPSSGGSMRDTAAGATATSRVDRRINLPYGVAMSAGLAAVAWFPNLLR